MPEYLILIHSDEKAWQQVDAAVAESTLRGHAEFQQANSAHLRGGNRVRPSAMSMSIRSDVTGGVVVTEGAFTETKETLGGYYLIEAADMNEAVTIAKQVPEPFGGIEVRPVWMADET